MHSRGKRAIALVTVLLATVVLAMFSGSLVVLARQGLTSGEWVRRREVTTAAAQSGLDYARLRLAQNIRWARSPFNSTIVIDDAQLRVLESGNTPEANLVEGLLKEAGATFRVRVRNGLPLRARQSAPGWSRTAVEIPAACALVQVQAEYKGHRRTFEVILRRDSTLTHAIDASGDFAVNWGAGNAGNHTVSFRSRIPRGNAVRAAGSIHLPDLAVGTVQFSGGRGTLQSGNDTTVNTTLTFDSAGNVQGGYSGQGLDGNNALVNATSSATNAKVDVMTPISPRRFDSSQLQIPSSPPRSLAAGEYVFIGPETVRHTASNSVYQGEVGNGTVVLSNFRFIPQGNVEVDGQLILRGEIKRRTFVNGSFVEAEDPTAVPVSLGLGYTSTGLPKASGEGKDRLTVNGSVLVQGDLVGGGQLFVNQSGAHQGNLTVNGNSFLSSTRTDGLALVTEGQLAFRDVSSGQEVMPFSMSGRDAEFFNAAVQAEAAIPSSNAVLMDIHASDTADRLSMTGFSDNGTTGLRNRSVGLNRQNYLNTILGGTPGNLTFTPGGLNVTSVNVSFGNATVSAANAITQFIQGCPSNVTLGEHLRVREFVKSLDFVDTKTYMIERGNVAYSNNTDPNLGPVRNTDEDIAQLIINQLQAYDQDARNREEDLLTYLAQAAADDPYVETARSDLIFGGLMFSGQNIYTKISRQFRLFGSIMANGTIGFDQLLAGRFMFDSTLTEDHFDLSKVGLVPLLFWCD